jgi:hypothetical protein
MYGEFLRFEGFEVVAFDQPGPLLVEQSKPPRAVVVDAWTAVSSEMAIAARIRLGATLVTSTTLRLADLWRCLGAARVHIKPISLDDLCDDLRRLACGPGPSEHPPSDPPPVGGRLLRPA